MWSKSHVIRILVAFIIIAAGGYLLFKTASLTPESLARQDAVNMALAPGRVRDASAPSAAASTDPVLVYGAEVSPAIVDINDVPSRASEVDYLKEAYEAGLIDLDVNEGPVSDAVYHALVAESKRQAPDPSLQYAPAEGSAAAFPLAPGASFKSIEYSESQQGVPPDPDITVGRDHILAAVNTSFQVFDKSGNSLHGPMLFDDFWGSDCGTGSSVIKFDPFLDYDEKEGRYILGITAYDEVVNGGDNGYACIAVSQTDSATGLWNLYSFDGNPGDGTEYFFDYPHIGVGQKALYLSANMFGSSFVRNHVFAYDKMAMYAGGDAGFIKFDESSSFTIQPAKMHGFSSGAWPSDFNEPHYFVDAEYGNNKRDLNVWKLSDPFGSPSFVSAGSVTVPTYSLPVEQPQLGNSSPLQGNDDRLLDVKYWGGKLYASQTIGCNPGSGTVNCIRWYIIDVSSGAASLVDQGTLASDGLYRSFPAIAPNVCGDLMVGYTMTSSSMYPSVYVAGRESGDPAGLLKDETLLKAGEDPYFAYDVPQYYDAYRWGDYSGMGIDPDGQTFWYMGEYSRDQANADWATWIGSYTYPDCTGEPPPPTPTPLPGGTMHVSDLDASSAADRGNKWIATAAITIQDEDDNPLSNAAVSGIWSDGSTGTAVCTTDANGQCDVSKSGLRVTSVTFSVSNVTHATDTYDSSANADPDGDSDGTTIIIYKDGPPPPTPVPTNTPIPTVPPPPTPTPIPGTGPVMHIGDLDGSTVTAARNRWNATVTILVHDALEDPVSGATAAGSWSGGATGSDTCVTDGSGHCAIIKTSIKGNTSAVTFTITNITMTDSTYDNAANHDPDGDSSGTTITVPKP